MRRDLRFKSFDDAREELKKLGEGPVETHGLWSYFQILTHCAASMERTMAGLEPNISWWRKHILGPIAYRKIILDGLFPIGIKGNPQIALDHREEGDTTKALARLHKAMEDFEKFEGKFSIHPRLGRLDKNQWLRFHSLHMANHLGYAHPKN